MLSLVLLALAPPARAAEAPGVSRTMSCEDILDFVRPVSATLSSDGTQLAFVTRRADLSANSERHALFVIATNGQGAARLVAEEAHIANVSWLPNSRDVAFVTNLRTPGSSLEVWDTVTGKKRHSLPRADGLRRFSISPDGQSVALVVTVRTASEDAQRIKDTGLVYDWVKHDFIQLAQSAYDRHLSDRIVLRSLVTDTERAVWTSQPLSIAGSHDRFDCIGAMVWSPDGAKLAVSSAADGDPAKGEGWIDWSVGIIDLVTGVCANVDTGPSEGEFNPAWTADSKQLYYRQLSTHTGHRESLLRCYSLAENSSRTIGPVPDELGSIREILSSADGAKLLVTTGRGIFEWDAATHRFTSLSPTLEGLPSFIAASSASFDRTGRKAAVFLEDTVTPPGIGVIDGASGAVRRLVDLNPHVDSFRLGRVEKVGIRNKHEQEVDAYLVYPVDHRPGLRHPLIVVSYGFRGAFITDAEWHNTFPAQVFAAQGYALLLLNNPPTIGDRIVGDPVRARWASGWNWLATVDAAVETVDRMGVADMSRLGFYGWSTGGFLGQFAGAHRGYFKAIAVGECRDVNPATYQAAGMRNLLPTYVNLYGGLLDRGTLAAYEEFAPAMNVHRMTAPMLHEFGGGRGAVAVQLFMLQRTAGLPAELVFYDGQDHQFESPRAILASMNRKLDWFNYWMLGKEDPDPAKAEQYVRWRKMKTAWEKTKATRRKPDAAGPSLAKVEKAP